MPNWDGVVRVMSYVRIFDIFSQCSVENAVADAVFYDCYLPSGNHDRSSVLPHFSSVNSDVGWFAYTRKPRDRTGDIKLQLRKSE